MTLSTLKYMSAQWHGQAQMHVLAVDRTSGSGGQIRLPLRTVEATADITGASSGERNEEGKSGKDSLHDRKNLKVIVTEYG
jgi:hypothetical protein